jgi:hypothetical protein
MQDQDLMKTVANKLLDGVNWGDLPWDWTFTNALYQRLVGKIDVMPPEAIATGGGPTIPDYSAASANEESHEMGSMLARALDFRSSPEGHDFWYNVLTVFVTIENNWKENQDERN